ncbi:hypothetical protein R3W88_008002 [Solanum pinnatisectum]|uniref:Uncharacterized protein n=1 Tax=Solanum pinnatisectum TaxID=50273 RepID=A0AAV9M7E1_9SOLN|nr:hypothetical protein R3W88_008002 [Solanum pinnatisectum]
MNMSKELRPEAPNSDRNDSSLATPAGYHNQIDVVHPAEATIMQEEAELMQKKMKEQKAKNQNTNLMASEKSSKDTQSSNFSFRIKDYLINVTPISILYVMQDTNQGKDVENSGQEQQQVEQTRQSHLATGESLETKCW